MATNHTPNYALSQWEASDPVVRADFNADNAKIDAALAEKADKVSVPRIVVGTYVGDGNKTQTVPLGFTPEAVYVCSGNGHVFRFTSEGHNGSFYGGLALKGHPSTVVSIIENGFMVKYDVSREPWWYANSINLTYYYVALA